MASWLSLVHVSAGVLKRDRTLATGRFWRNWRNGGVVRAALRVTHWPDASPLGHMMPDIESTPRCIAMQSKDAQALLHV